MKMGVKVYYAEISGHKEVKKRQQRVMMILESKLIPYEAIDITEPGKEADKEFMMKNGKPRGDSKYVLSPQIFNEQLYCGDYDDFDLANENDVLEVFLHTPKVERHLTSLNGAHNGTGSRESSTEAEVKSITVGDVVTKAETIKETAISNTTVVVGEHTSSTTVLESAPQEEDLGLGEEEAESPKTDNDETKDE